MGIERLVRGVRRRIRVSPTEYVPVVDFKMPEFVPGETDLCQWIQTGINGFKEWYQPVDFGDGLVAHVTVPPDWNASPDLDELRGSAKWDFIVKRHIPDITGKRVMDLGCNNGVFCLKLAEAGAKEVIGIDRDRSICQRSAPNLPIQDVIDQAKFVKQAFEIKRGIKYPIKYIAADVADVSVQDFGRFDMILAFCIVYHELSFTPQLLKKLSLMTDHLVLQTNLLHTGELAHWASLYVLAELLIDVGYTQVEIDAPASYSWPMVIGKR